MDVCRRLLHRIMCGDSRSGLELACHFVTPLEAMNSEEAVCGTGWPLRCLGVVNDATRRAFLLSNRTSGCRAHKILSLAA